MSNLLIFFFILFVGLLATTLLRKLHFPWVISLILGGILIGPQGFNLFTPNYTTEFIGELGLTFLMFMAGLETKLDSIKESNKDLIILSIINGSIPLLLGLGVGYYYNYNLTTIFMIGIVFVSSSIAVVIPTLEVNKLFNLKIGRSVMITSIFQDITSLILLSILLQNINNTSNIPLYLFYPALLIIIVLMRYALPKVGNFLAKITRKEKDFFQEEIRAILLILMGTVIIFELLGLHLIIAGFFAGLVLSDTVTKDGLLEPIRTISYGIFIPAFFILIGINTNILILFEAGDAIILTTVIVVGSILSKFLSGLLGAKIVGFNNAQAVFFGASSIPQLSTTLAVSYTAKNLGLISNELNTAFVVLSVVSTFIGPIIMSKINKKTLAINIIEKVTN